MIDRNIYTLNITWDAPTYQPDSYTLYTTDLSPLGKRQKFNVSRDMHSFFIDGIEIYGLWFEVRLTATTLGGSSTAAVTEVTSTISHIPEKNPLVKVIAAVVAPIFCVVILSMTIFMIYHRKAKLKRYQERCKYFEELEKKAPTDPKDNFDFMHTFNVNDKKPPTDILNMSLDSQLHENTALFNDEMEINRSQLTLYEVLGEGAFGLVKRGIYKDSKMSTSYEVAVKMLKDHPSGDEIRAFRREIEVMKSVEKHPNIVGIIGHCTRSSNAMMLLTEYCRFGNLLDFLRDEWRFLHELQRRRPLFGLTTLEVELPYIAGKRLQKLSAFNLFIEDELPSPPPPPTPPSSPPPPAAPSSISWASEETNSLQNIPPKKSNQGHKSMVKELIFEKANISQNVIEKFKRKYNELNKNGQNNGMQQSIENIGSMSMAMALCTTSSSKELKMLQGLAQQQNAFSSELGSPAAENKSYGYEGCCTNSCKCNVDVIITNIDATESRSREQEELSRLLAQQEEVEQQEPRVYSPNKGKLSNNTIIAIKNCDCRHQLTAQSPHKPQRPTLRCHASADKPSSGPHENIPHKGAVENTTYFKLFNSTSSSSTKNLKSLPVGKASKSPSPTPLGPRLNDDDDTWQTTRIPLTAGDLLDIARQVAVGMDFLAKNKVVHRDLAARNVLVAPDRTVKIADFGLSRDIYQENIYKKTGNGKLPIKWLALESLTHQVYTTQSDVWSYGILLYEIVTLGATPYPSIPTNRLLHLLKTGYRMEKPKNCGQEFYDLMNSCWYSAPSERPTFNEIIGKLNEMLLELQKSEQPSQYPLQLDATAQETHARKNDETDDASKQDSPMQQLCTDDSYLKPL
uniref:receptor protein-tyrosine kinase n=1 Tax=Stomoxys calcitrans TaxID=35570 RepID=A0A1I8NXG9_STOCA